jgi:hypothetical protein
MRRRVLAAIVCAIGATFIHASAQAPQSTTSGEGAKGGYIIERDADVARQEPGPHKGGGQTIGHSFFSEVPNLELIFRKRVIKPGAGIG